VSRDIEEIKDVEGSNLEHIYGDRFRGWYVTKKFLRTETIPLNYKEFDLTYRFNIFDNRYRFVMPPKLEFDGGLITYSVGDRNLGLFRFPRDSNGNFSAPIPLDRKNLDVVNLSDDEIKKVLSRKEPLVFEAFKVPQFGFEFLDLTEKDVQEIAALTDSSFIKLIKEEYDKQFSEKTNEILEKIKSTPNYLLILKNTLGRQLRNLSEVSVMTDKIIHA
jgi:hypothetical protein